MCNLDHNRNQKTRPWEVLVILLIWLMAAALVYIVFRKATIELNIK
ncbi:hypothetical protein DYBT9275_00998 [Dyadobacter sp. CECT 9275]|uniref:Uncharacterized protein n=1 Tax=Dyadobacter helix TaxID=2822344 RepID=A0A916N4N2_9BACT|nr:hypothetical protein [Dyadobacter sp. CECT 9275]CAG4992616.1 hypothetical protein DYBT9275_00998 [Dyadobacter sp. CECT 9275]